MQDLIDFLNVLLGVAVDGCDAFVTELVVLWLGLAVLAQVSLAVAVVRGWGVGTKKSGDRDLAWIHDGMGLVCQVFFLVLGSRGSVRRVGRGRARGLRRECLEAG